MELLFKIIDIVAGVLFLVIGVLSFWVGHDDYIDRKKNMPHYTLAFLDDKNMIIVSICSFALAYLTLIKGVSVTDIALNFL